MKSSETGKLKVLHITPWFPNPDNPFEAKWIKRHIESIGPYVDQTTFHIHVARGRCLKFKRTKAPWGEQIELRLPTKRWFVFELCWFFILFILLIVNRHSKKADILQFHIAYPSLTYWNWLRPFIKTQVLIVEHWSAYHFNFGVKNIDKLNRIRKIFSHNIPVICVSKCLLDDLRSFSGHSNFESFVLPNAVDTSIFFPKTSTTQSHNELFMLSQWNWPKEPCIILSAFAQWNRKHDGKYILKIGGYGNQMPVIEEAILSLGLNDTVKVMGKLSEDQIATQMSRSLAFVHCSAYETFSVVCAEALCCGVPVVASSVGGITEFVHEGNGVLVLQNTVQSWCNSLEELISKKFNNSAIATEAEARFSDARIGYKYFQILNAVSGGTN